MGCKKNDQECDVCMGNLVDRFCELVNSLMIDLKKHTNISGRPGPPGPSAQMAVEGKHQYGVMTKVDVP